MITRCNACAKQLKLSYKMLESIEKLGPGKTIRLKCPGCEETIVLDSSFLTSGQSGSPPVGKKPKEPKQSIKPPAPPDISWLEEGVFEQDDVIEDVPLALILMEDSPHKDSIIESIEGIGYKTEAVTSSKEAMEKMQFVEYSAVVMHSHYEGQNLRTSAFHQYMCDMNMSRRRFIFYTLIGPEFKTLYNLQALAYSANLVVSEAEIPYFKVILRKAIPEYEELFGPITEELRLQGK